MLSKNGKLVKWNNEFEAITGYSRRQIEIMYALDFFNKNDKKTIEKAIKECFKKGSVKVKSSLLTKKGKNYITFLQE